MTVIAIIDYDIGNTRSISNSLVAKGVKVIITSDKIKLLSADGVILPGVGSFKHGMDKLRELKLDMVIRDYVKSGKPLLGICLGMQLLFTRSEEFGETEGLNLIHGLVKKLQLSSDEEFKLPHVNWNSIHTSSLSWKESILKNITAGSEVYFVHSYAVLPSVDKNILSTTIYSNNQFISAVQCHNVYGCQFHPEKSGTVGLTIMNNFIEICRG